MGHMTKQWDAKRKGSKVYFRVVGITVLLFLLIAACGDGDGEDRPGIQVIGGETGSVSVSVSGTGTDTGTGTGTGTATGTGTGTGTGTATGTGTGTGPGPSTVKAEATEHYTPVSNVDSHAAITLDMRDIADLLQAARSGDTVDWDEITDIYENGRHSISSSGTVRSLRGLGTSSSVLEQFPGEIDLDANVEAGLTGVWLGEGIDDATRRQLVNKGVQAIIYGKVLQEIAAARAKVVDGNIDDASGAPHNVDEAWAFYVGVPGPEGDYPYGVSATARSREANFGLEGMVDAPLQQALATVLEASRSGDLTSYDAAAEEVRGYLNTIFYLATLRYGARVMDDEDAVGRKIHLAEGWAFYQPIHPAVSGASMSSASTVEGHFTRNAANPVSSEDVDQLYAALNTEKVISALGIPVGVRVTSPSQLR